MFIEYKLFVLVTWNTYKKIEDPCPPGAHILVSLLLDNKHREPDYVILIRK